MKYQPNLTRQELRSEVEYKEERYGIRSNSNGKPGQDETIPYSKIARERFGTDAPKEFNQGSSPGYFKLSSVVGWLQEPIASGRIAKEIRFSNLSLEERRRLHDEGLLPEEYADDMEMVQLEARVRETDPDEWGLIAVEEAIRNANGYNN